MRYAFALLLALTASALAKPLPSSLPPLGAFAAGIAYTSAAELTDPSAIWWNPAALQTVPRPSAALNLTSFTSLDFANWSLMMVGGKQGGPDRVGLGLVRRNGVDSRGEFRSFEFLVPFCFPVNAAGAPIGVSLKFLAETRSQKWRYTAGLDAGVAIHTPTGGWSASLSSQNIVRGRLGSFARQSWLGFAYGSDTSAVKLMFQTRFDHPGDFDFMSQNYAVGARMLGTQKYPAAQVGYIREDTHLRFSLGASYARPRADFGYSVAFLFDPKHSSDRTYFFTLGMFNQ